MYRLGESVPAVALSQGQARVNYGNLRLIFGIFARIGAENGTRAGFLTPCLP
jgi:hypothetical protein